MSGPAPTCGHSVCSQNYVDTGDINCTRQKPPPKNKRTVRFEVHSTPDAMNRQQFTIRWWDQNFHGGPRWRAQVFFAVVKEYADKYKHVEIVEDKPLRPR